MAIEGLTGEQIVQYENQLLELVPAVEAVGNLSLRTTLTNASWSEDLYWEIRNRLVERGSLTTGRGKGGSVRRVPPPVVPVPIGEPSVLQQGGSAVELLEEAGVLAFLAEKDLYPPMAEVIKSKWAQDYRLDSLIVEITAVQGSKVTGGKWTRPDITVASLKTFPYVPGRHFDVITFEIKPRDSIDVTVVYEALGHRRAATRAYALLHVPEAERAGADQILEEICLEAKRFGVGVVVAGSPDNYDTWEELVEAVRHEPDPERLNDFLTQQVSQGFREQIIRWFK